MYLFALVSLFYLIFKNILRKRVEATNDLEQESQRRGPRAVCGSRGRFVRPAMLFGNFQIFNIYAAECLEKRCREVNEPTLNDTLAVVGYTTDQHFHSLNVLIKKLDFIME